MIRLLFSYIIDKIISYLRKNSNNLYETYFQMNVNTVIVLLAMIFLISYTGYRIYKRFYCNSSSKIKKSMNPEKYF